MWGLCVSRAMVSVRPAMPPPTMAMLRGFGDGEEGRVIFVRRDMGGGLHGVDERTFDGWWNGRNGNAMHIDAWLHPCRKRGSRVVGPCLQCSTGVYSFRMGIHGAGYSLL